jgi:amphi-Trp domain-containing protein
MWKLSRTEPPGDRPPALMNVRINFEMHDAKGPQLSAVRSPKPDTQTIFVQGNTMAAKKSKRDVEKGYPKADFVAKLRRLADAIEQGERFKIQIAGERIYVPVRAIYNIEHERAAGLEEIEFQIKWEPE